MVRGALFKRTEEEKGLGGWAPAPRRGIRTVAIPESAREREKKGSQQSGPPLELHPGRLHGVRHMTQPTSPAAHAAGDVRHREMRALPMHAFMHMRA